jgi:hypothetical protein
LETQLFRQIFLKPNRNKFLTNVLKNIWNKKLLENTFANKIENKKKFGKDFCKKKIEKI